MSETQTPATKAMHRIERLERTVEILTNRIALLEHAHNNPACHNVFVGPAPTTGGERLAALAGGE